jgi:hypothetical protein
MPRPRFVSVFPMSLLPLLFLGGCGGNYNGNSGSPGCSGVGSCAKPTISSISLASAAVNSGPVPFTITGSNFALGDSLTVLGPGGSLVIITSQSSSTTLAVTIPNSALQIEGTSSIQVRDNTSGNATTSLPFTITTACPVQGNEAALANASPQWIFLVEGENAGNPMAMAGLFAPDGMGGILFGTEDINVMGSAPLTNQAVILPSYYSEDSTGRGCLELHTAASLKIFHFAGKQMMEFDDTIGTGEKAAGTMAAALKPGAVAGFSGGIFGLEGWDMAGGHAAVAGNFATQGNGGGGLIGSITGGLCDTNDAGTLNSSAPIPPGGIYNIVSGVAGQPSGRGTISFTAGPILVDGVIYLGNAGNFLILSTTQVSTSVPLLSGRGGGFNPNYLIGTSNYYLFISTGRYRAMVGIFNLTSNTATTGTYAGSVAVVDANSAGGGPGFTGDLFTVTHPVWGRVAFQFANNSGLNIVAYIQGGGGNASQVTGVTVGADSDAASGTLSFQANVATNYTYSDFAFSAAYSNYHSSRGGVTTKLGVITFDGNGGYTGTVDQSAPFGLGANLPFSGSFGINRDGFGSLDQFSPFVSVFTPSSPRVASIYYINGNSVLVHPAVSAVLTN